MSTLSQSSGEGDQHRPRHRKRRSDKTTLSSRPKRHRRPGPLETMQQQLIESNAEMFDIWRELIASIKHHNAEVRRLSQTRNELMQQILDKLSTPKITEPKPAGTATALCFVEE